MKNASIDRSVEEDDDEEGTQTIIGASKGEGMACDAERVTRFVGERAES